MTEANYIIKYSIGDVEKLINVELAVRDESEDEKTSDKSKLNIQYTYDKNGNITAILEDGKEQITYVYDGFNQLIRENNKYIEKTILYTYDNGGNILRKDEYAFTEDEPTQINHSSLYFYGDGNWKDLITEYAGETITYDEIGNPLSYRNGLSFEWTGKKLTEVVNRDNVISYTYNCDGIRTSKSVNGEKTVYYYDGKMLIAEEIHDNIIWYTYNRESEVVGFEYKNEMYYYEKNGQSDIISIVDKSGNTISEYVYDTWGNVIEIKGNTEIGNINPFRYRGYYYDNETGLYYIQSRYYDPVTGRFVSADVMIDNGAGILGSNMYAYCVNNPVNMVDIGGYAPEYITDQNNPNGEINGVKYVDIPIGLFGNLHDNGCGVIAAYNVLISQNIKTSLSNVLLRLTLYGGILAWGKGGISPGSISLLMCKYFSYVNTCLVTSSEWVAQQYFYDAVIILHIHSNGAHYVAGIRANCKLSSNVEYQFYNVGNIKKPIDGKNMSIKKYLQYINENGEVPLLIIGVLGKK